MRTTIKYYDYWRIGEKLFKSQWLAKYETILAQGNGYMGIRAATEESYSNEIRNTFVAGTFNNFDETSVTELPNVPDMIEMKIKVNNQILNLNKGHIENYTRYLNIKNGELHRSFVWTSPDNEQIKFKFQRFVSFNRKHVFGQKVSIQPLTNDTVVEIISGINGQVTNSGAQHFHDGNKRIHDNQIIQMVSETTNTNINFIMSTVHSFKLSNKEINPSYNIEMPRRKVLTHYTVDVPKNESVTVEKLSNIYTSRDLDSTNKTVDEISTEARIELNGLLRKGYTHLLDESANNWKSNVWDYSPIIIKSKNIKDQLAINFARYHLHVSTPSHDSRMNIGAKGLTGEGYKGHTFWDSEIFILPYYIYTYPETARSLLEYRYHGLESAQENARNNGFSGAQYPWEAAWITDGETTPELGAPNIITGEATPILTGIQEHHITADVAHGIVNYAVATNDLDFMEKMGYEILIATAKFWVSRLEFDSDKFQYVINTVIGPDEYKEGVNNNAYTNYLAHANMIAGLKTINHLKKENGAIYKNLDKKYNFNDLEISLKKKVAKLYLPELNSDGILPQDDTYLSKKIIDLDKYYKHESVGSIFYDYNMEQVGEIQVSKQMDVLLLMYLFKNLFSDSAKNLNWDYYVPKTLHDSSLSYGIHSAFASYLNREQDAYEMFSKAIDIDMGPAMNSSDEGIHTASLGAIWQSVVFGFGGIDIQDKILNINPVLPKDWDELSFNINWRGNVLELNIQKSKFKITNHSNQEIEFITAQNTYKVGEKPLIINI